MGKLVSVIMSVYNEDEVVVSKAIESILEQTYDNLEFIIVLDNPNNINVNNKIIDYKSKDNRIKLIFNEKNLGLVESLNKALALSNGEYIARMDADDISILNRIELEKKFIEENNLDFVFSTMEYMDENEKYIGENNRKIISPVKLEKILSIVNISNHPTWFVKKEVFDELNGYREIPYCEDYDFILRSLAKGYKIGRISENTLRYRIRTNSISRSNSLNQFLNMRSISKLYNSNNIESNEILNEIITKNRIIASDSNIEKFRLSNEYFNKSNQYLKNKKILKGITCMLYSIVSSKLYTIKLYDLLRYKYVDYMS